MNWTRVKPYDDSDTLYWISGIYKVLTYDGRHFHAYFIQDGQKNWGDCPTQAPNQEIGYHSRFWPSLESAQGACEEHARKYRPERKTEKRAAELLESFLAAA